MLVLFLARVRSCSIEGVSMHRSFSCRVPFYVIASYAESGRQKAVKVDFLRLHEYSNSCCVVLVLVACHIAASGCLLLACYLPLLAACCLLLVACAEGRRCRYCLFG